MRRVPVITLASLVAVLAVMAAPVYSATLFGNDTPDIRLGIGVKADKAFDLNDFFDSATSKTIGYTQDGAAVTDPVVSIFGNSKAGATLVKFVATANGESVETESVVQVSNFSIQNVPAIDNNNRLAGVAAGNAFLNGIVPGKSVTSAEALTLAGGANWGYLTGTAATGSAALIATIGEVKVSYAGTGLVQRDCAVLAEATKGVATYGGLTATFTPDGKYKLAAASTFAGPFVVTLGQVDGSSADGVHVLAAKATNVELAEANFVAMTPTGIAKQAAAVYAGGVLTITAKAGEGILIVGQTGVAASGEVTVSMDYKTSAADAGIAVVGFDTAGVATLGADQGKISYSLIKGSKVVEANAVKNVATLINARSGKVLPGLQVVAGTSDTTVVISGLSVISAGVLADYAINPNATADLDVAGDFASITGLMADLANSGAVAGTLSASDNHFASPNGSGALKLTATADKPANGAVPAAVGAGTFYGEAWVKKVSDTGTGLFYFHVANTDGYEFRSQTAVSALGSDWTKVDVMGVAAAGTQYVVLQVSGAAVLVDDLSVRLLDDSDKFFDYALLGL